MNYSDDGRLNRSRLAEIVKRGRNLLVLIVSCILFLTLSARAQTESNEPSFYSEETLESILDVVLGYPLIVGGIVTTCVLGLLLYLGLTDRIGRNIEKRLSQEDIERNGESTCKKLEDIDLLPLYGTPIPWTKANEIKFRDVRLSPYLKSSVVNSALVQTYVLTYREAKGHGWVAGGLIEITYRHTNKYVRFIWDPETKTHRVPEQFIRCVIGGNSPHRIVFLFDPDMVGSSELMSKVFSKFNVLLPNYHSVQAEENVHEPAKTSFEVDNLNCASIAFEYNKVHLWRQIQYYMVLLRFNLIYRRNAIFWFLCGYLDELLRGLFIAMIFITAESMGVLSAYNVILHITPVFIALFAWPVMAKIETNLVRLRRDRRSSEDEGSYWDRKIQNYEAFGKIKGYIRLYGLTYVAVLLLFFLTIPPKKLEGGWGSSLTVQLTPALFLFVFLIWHLIEETMGQFIGEIMAEIDSGEIYYSDDGVKRGFASVGDSISTVEGIFNQLFMISSFMIGYGIYHVGLYNLMLPLFFSIGSGGIICWFTYPLFFGESVDMFLEIGQSVFLPGSTENSLWLSDNIEIIFTPKDRRLENIEPIHVCEDKAVLPWVRDLGVKLTYRKKPIIRVRRRLWVMKYVELCGIHGDPRILIKQRMRSISQADVHLKEKGCYEISLGVRT